MQIFNVYLDKCSYNFTVCSEVWVEVVAVLLAFEKPELALPSELYIFSFFTFFARFHSTPPNSARNYLVPSYVRLWLVARSMKSLRGRDKVADYVSFRELDVGFSKK